MKAGVDEAGRGPVLGPMVMAIVAIDEQDRQWLNKIGVKDSKLLTPLKRNKLSRLIRERLPHVIIKVQPQDIDKAVDSPDDSLNLLEARTTTKLIQRLAKKCEFDSVILDLPSKNKQTYLAAVREHLKEDVPIAAEHKADLNYAEVAAASILAKVARDASMHAHSKRLDMQLGSGYPSDPKTKLALQHFKDTLFTEGIIRRSWKTAKDLGQKTLGSW